MHSPGDPVDDDGLSPGAEGRPEQRALKERAKEGRKLEPPKHHVGLQVTDFPGLGQRQLPAGRRPVGVGGEVERRPAAS